MEAVPEAILRASVIMSRPVQVDYSRGEYQIMIISLRSMLTAAELEWLSRRKSAC